MLTRFDDCFSCHCCGKLPKDGMDARLIEVLNKMDVQEEEVNSGYRCEFHNAEVGGVKNSFHVQGCAADIDASNYGVDVLAGLAESCGADGIGKYYGQNFVHCDTRGYAARWEE